MADDSNETTQQPAPEAPRGPSLLDAHDYTKFLLYGKKEIIAVLRGLQNSVALITAFFNEGKELLPTTLLDVDEDGMILDFGADHDTNRRALNAERLICVASQERVRIQFEAKNPAQVQFSGSPAFRAPLPASVLRLQRRDFFRLAMPITRPLKCSIPLPDAPEGGPAAIEVSVVDISGGGFAMSVPKGMTLESGQEFANCSIELPEVGTITISMTIRNVFEVELRSGARVTRAGCEFIKPGGATMALIQRYIMKVERERKARESGLL
ncbi:MAG: flagellar brake protein [Ignavibacteria bacterium]